MSISITELTPGFVGEVSGIDITQPLTSAIKPDGDMTTIVHSSQRAR